jgi:YbbR domain-containing protein
LSGFRKYLYGKQIFVFLFFVAAASVGWLMNRLSTDYLRTISYHINFYNSSDMRRIFNVETDVTAQVNMNGFLAMRYNISEQNIIKIDINDKVLSKTKNFVLSSDIFQKFSEQLGDGKKLISLSPDTIYFSYVDLQSKRLPIIPNLQLKFASEYMQSGNIILKPDSIWITAEQNVLDSITEIQCIAQKHENLNKPISGALEVDMSKLNNVSVQQQKIQFKVNVERYSEATITVPLQLTNKPDSLDVMTFPRDIEVKYRADIQNFAKIKASDFKLIADFNDFEKSISGNLKVKIETKPKSVLQVDLYPDFVEAIVSKK